MWNKVDLLASLWLFFTLFQQLNDPTLLSFFTYSAIVVSSNVQVLSKITLYHIWWLQPTHQLSHQPDKLISYSDHRLAMCLLFSIHWDFDSTSCLRRFPPFVVLDWWWSWVAVLFVSLEYFSFYILKARWLSFWINNYFSSSVFKTASWTSSFNALTAPSVAV